MQTTSQATSNASGFADDSEYLKKPDISALNGYYTDADSVDQDIFAEMRSNILLASGEHYNKRRSNFFKRIRDTKELSQEQKLRLVKNHTQKICKTYANNILAMDPGVGFSAKDENSMHDQKVAELHHSVWQDAVQRYSLQDRMEEWCDSFIQIGELAVKLFYDPALGNLKGYEAQTDSETDEPLTDEEGQIIANEGSPVFEGEFVFEEIYGFNLLRPPECKDMRKSEWLGIRKMVNKSELLRLTKDNPDIQKFIRSDQDETYVVFDALNGGYKKTNKQTMIREYYFRPSLLFPQGYFYITTKEGILAEGELPGGLFPIVFTAFDKIATTPRGRSPIKIMRPYQAEINRAASKIAEHQITLGDDKLLLQNGTKISAGISLPGVRAVNYTGAEPKVLQGRSGEQYLGYMQSQIGEMYDVLMVVEDSMLKEGQMDPYVMLFRSAKQKKRFQRYISRFEKFLIELVKLYLQLAKLHMPDDAVVWAVGKNEQVNIPEFRQYADTCYEIKIEAQSDDIETKLGKQLVLNHALQYVGPQMKPDDIGKLLRQMPYANLDEDFDDLTIDYDSIRNDMLAMDRGEQPPVGQYDNHIYSIKRLTLRMRKPDFKFLAPPIQQAYAMRVQLHQQMEAKNQEAIQRAEAGFIPTDGYLVGCDFYVPDPADPVKNRRARVPYTALAWLLKQLETQGQSQEQLEQMGHGALAQMAQNINSATAGHVFQQPPQQSPQQQGQNPMAMMPRTPSPQPAPAMGR